MIRRESAARENCYGAVPREHLLLEETSYKHKPPKQNIQLSSTTYHTVHIVPTWSNVSERENPKGNVKPSVLHRAHHQTIANCLGQTMFLRKNQAKSNWFLKIVHTVERFVPEQVDQVASPPLVALVVGRGKINQEINYYNAKIGSVAPNIENKMKMIFL